jgi:hypothetical protein
VFDTESLDDTVGQEESGSRTDGTECGNDTPVGERDVNVENDVGHARNDRSDNKPLEEKHEDHGALRLHLPFPRDYHHRLSLALVPVAVTIGSFLA